MAHIPSYQLHRWKIYHPHDTCANQSPSWKCYTTASMSSGSLQHSLGSHNFWVHMGSPANGEIVQMPNGNCLLHQAPQSNPNGTTQMSYNVNLSTFPTPVAVHTDCQTCVDQTTPLFHEWASCNNGVTQNLLGAGIGGNNQGGGVVNWAINNHWFWVSVGAPSIGQVIKMVGPGNTVNCYTYLGTNTVSAGASSNAIAGGFQFDGTHNSCSSCNGNGPVPSWNCVNGNCQDPGNGTGTFSTLSDCQASCAVLTASWDCDNGNCYDPGTGNGQYSSLSDCNRNCNNIASWDCDGCNCVDPLDGSGQYPTEQDCLDNCANPPYSQIIYSLHDDPSVCTYQLMGTFQNGNSCSQHPDCVPGPQQCPPGNTCPECWCSLTMQFEYETSPGSGNWITLQGTIETVDYCSTFGYNALAGQAKMMQKSCSYDQFALGGATNYRFVVHVGHIDPNDDYTFEGDPYYVNPPTWLASDQCGCTDPTATNYNATAVCDDGSCTYPSYIEWQRCGSSSVWNFVPQGLSLTATNTVLFWDQVGQPNVGEVIELIGTGDRDGCWELLPSNTSPASSGIDISTSGIIVYNDCITCSNVYGCTDPNATNYNPAATIDDGSCLYPPDPPIPGCTDPNAINNTYNPAATADCMNNVIGSVAYTNIGIYGDTSCCDYPIVIYGCTDPNACNYDPTATIDDGSCTFPGCTDLLALNYDPNAGCNDGSCIYPPGPVLGCTDPNALNYNPLATQDDGSCEYPPDDPPPGVLNTNPCDTINIITVIPNPCDLLEIAHIWSNRVNTGTGGCVDTLLDDLIMSVALYEMLDETIKNN